MRRFVDFVRRKGVGSVNPSASYDSASVRLDISGFSAPATAAVAKTIFRSYVMTSTDGKIDHGKFTLEFPVAPALNRPVRGRWWVSLVEQTGYQTFRRLTSRVVVSSVGFAPIALGNPSGRMSVGRVVFLEVEYEAGAAAASEVVFWAGATGLNVTVHQSS